MPPDSTLLSTTTSSHRSRSEPSKLATKRKADETDMSGNKRRAVDNNIDKEMVDDDQHSDSEIDMVCQARSSC